MTSVEEAKRIMMERVPLLFVEAVGLDDARGYVTEDVIAHHEHPLFDMSAVDGYAFTFDEVTDRRIVGAVAAGDVFPRSITSGEAVRIFTGAMLPQGANAVVMQEFATIDGDRLVHSDTRLERGANIRKQGEQLRKNDVVLPAGTLLDPAAIGLLASIGAVELAMCRKPAVAVITTGGEFAEPADIRPGKVFNSNGIMLRSALEREVVRVSSERVVDDERALMNAFQRAAANADVVITTGGASVGDHDLIKPVLEKMRAIIHFHGVAQKPGKPMLFATLNGKPVFGLPGNPRAVLVLFWEYVLPFLRAMQGAKDPWLRTDNLPLAHEVNVKGDRSEFRAARVKGGKVMLLADEGSHMLRSLVDADALAYIPADLRSFREGDPMEVHYLPR